MLLFLKILMVIFADIDLPYKRNNVEIGKLLKNSSSELAINLVLVILGSYYISEKIFLQIQIHNEILYRMICNMTPHESFCNLTPNGVILQNLTPEKKVQKI